MKLFDGGWTNILVHKNGKSKKINKAWEFNIYWAPALDKELRFELDFWGNILFSINIFGLIRLGISRTYDQDHAGFNATFKLLGLEVEYTYYDTRHWDYDNNKWEEYPENE